MVYNDWDSLIAGGSNGASVALEDKFEGLQRLVQMGKEKGYVLYDEVSEVLPGDLPGGSELEDVLAGLDVAGIEILEEPKDFDKKLDESEELLDLELPAGVGEKVNDPVRMYLREMGTVPLLTREGEVEIARRIERGQNTVLKSLSRAPLVIQEILRHGRGDGARRAFGARRGADRRSDPHRRAGGGEAARVHGGAPKKSPRQYRRILQCRQKLQAIPRGMKPKQYRRQLWELGRLMVRTSRLVRTRPIPEPGDPPLDRPRPRGGGGAEAGRARNRARAAAAGDLAGRARRGRQGTAQGAALP